MGCGSSLESEKPAFNADINRNESPKHAINGKPLNNGIHESLIYDKKKPVISKKTSFKKHKKKSGSEFDLDVTDGTFGDGLLGITVDKERLQLLLDTLHYPDLFCDPDFVADRSALFISKDLNPFRISWMRPYELVGSEQTPQLMVDGMTRDDIQQGSLGDCWYLSSCAAVSQQERFMSKIMPRNQVLFGDGYKGIVHFRFWRFGEWVDVFIDDRLPTTDGKLIYAHCTDTEEFWVALIEKAYAKLHGSYEAIEGGQTMDALVDLTGGLAERYDLDAQDPNMYRLLMRAHKSGAFIACSRKGDWRRSNVADANGLVSGHAYTITGISRITHQMGEEKLLRIRNPWGDGTEWKGAWSDEDSNWQWVDVEVKAMLGLQAKDDGEFWMSYRDFCRQFQEVTICLMGPDFDGDGVSDQVGQFAMMKGAWTKDKTAGGSRNNLELFATNPQFVLTVTEADDFNPLTDDPESEGKCSVVIALMQDHRCSKRNIRVKTLQIGFMLYATDNPNTRLQSRHFKYHHDCGKSGVYINYREVSGRFELDPGHYVIIPSTFQAGDSASLMLRVFGEKTFQLNQLPDVDSEEPAFNSTTQNPAIVS